MVRTRWQDPSTRFTGTLRASVHQTSLSYGDKLFLSLMLCQEDSSEFVAFKPTTLGKPAAARLAMPTS